VRQSQLVLPLLAALDQHGPLRGRDAADVLAQRFNVPTEERTRRIVVSGKTINAWDRTVRFTQLRARTDGLTDRDEHGRWLLTRRGRNTLSPATPGVIVRIYEDDQALVLWAEAEAVEGILEPRSVTTIVTSPPYPIETQKRYGGRVGRDYERWLIERAAAWRDALTDDGSLFLNLGDAYLPETPTLSLYQERVLLALTEQLGYHLAGKFYWENPQRLPAPAAWVTIKRCRVTATIEPVYWLSKSPFPKADNRRVLREYSPSMRRALRRGTNAGVRPSGYRVAEGAFDIDHGGSIPTNVIRAGNSQANPAYVEACERLGLPRHPATFPAAIPEMAIGISSIEGDLVWDPFGGHLETARTALRMNRRVIINDSIREYLESGLYHIGLAA
jgi:DNA modification methylase